MGCSVSVDTPKIDPILTNKIDVSVAQPRPSHFSVSVRDYNWKAMGLETYVSMGDSLATLTMNLRTISFPFLFGLSDPYYHFCNLGQQEYAWNEMCKLSSGTNILAMVHERGKECYLCTAKQIMSECELIDA